MKLHIFGSNLIMFAALSIAAIVPSSAEAATYKFSYCYDNNEDGNSYTEDVTCEVTDYEVLNKSLVQLNYTPVMQQEHIISVAKGQTESLTQSKTVSRTTKVSATVSAKEPLFNVINASLTASYSGTVSEIYSTTQIYNGPPESSSYNSRNYYSGTVYDLHQISVREHTYIERTYREYDYDWHEVYVYEYPDEYIGVKDYINEQVQVPHFVTYSVDSLY